MTQGFRLFLHFKRDVISTFSLLLFYLLSLTCDIIYLPVPFTRAVPVCELGLRLFFFMGYGRKGTWGKKKTATCMIGLFRLASFFCTKKIWLVLQNLQNKNSSQVVADWRLYFFSPMGRNILQKK